ncbi:hypothetical protein GGF48_005085, partial [Coemansia sp. RSA 921]
PHVSFALAYALHCVATDMVAYTDKYPKVHGNWLRDARNIDTVAAVVLGERLGSSRSGTVYSGLAAGRPVAVKVADADADAEIIRELRSEVEVYQHLAELQGDDIPRLIDHGLLEVDGTLRPALVQKQIGNWAGADDQPEMLPLSVRQSAMDTPDRLHAPGVVHGDPRMDNLLFECADTPDCS